MLEDYLQNPDVRRRNPGLGRIREVPPTESKRSKYGNIKTEYNGLTYPSKKQAKRAQELDLMKRAGKIIAWFPEVTFPLSEDVSYRADAVIINLDLSLTIEDAKGMRTKEYRIKKKLFKTRYGQEIVEV